MATITTDTFLDGGTARTAGEAWTCNGGILTIRTDSRWHANAPASMGGTLGSVSISATLGGGYYIDATAVRWMAFDAGSGTVPAIGTTITGGTSGSTGYLLGVWASLTSAPTAVGDAMPTTGFIKFREVSAPFVDNDVLSGIGATANGVDKTGWIEVVHDTATAITVPRLGKFQTRGDWFYLDDTTGSANQLIQIPTNGSATAYVPGVWIETGVSTDLYEYYPSLYAAGMITTNLGTDIRSKFVCMETDGQVRIGHNGTTDVGYVPVAGCRVRIPNIFGRQSLAASRNLNNLPAAVAGTRPDFNTTSAGAIDIENFATDWYLSFAQPYSVRAVDSCTFNYLLVSEVATPIEVDNFGVGTAQSVDSRTFNATSCFAGGTISNARFDRFSSGSTDHAVEVIYCKDLTFTNVESGIITFARSTGMSFQTTQSTNITFNNCYSTNSAIQFTTSFDCVVNDHDHTDRYVGATTTAGIYAIYMNASCDNIVVDGITFGRNGTVANVHPYLGIVTIGQSSNIKVRNAGTRSSFLSGGSANNPAYIFVTVGNNQNVKLQRIYMTPTRTGAISTQNSDINFTYEHIYGDFADAMVLASSDSQVRNCGGTNTVTGQASIYGTNFWDVFTSDTAGRVVLSLNEQTAATTQYYTYVSGTPEFTSTGNLILATVGDEIIIECPYFIKGCTALDSAVPVITGTNVTYSSGARWGNHDIYYQIDTGSGYGGSWQNLTGANLAAETISPSTGFKLKYRLVCATAATTNLLTYIRINTVSTLAAQTDNLYPLDTVPVKITVKDAVTGANLEGARVYLIDSDDNVIINKLTDSSGIALENYELIGSSEPVTGRVRLSTTPGDLYVQGLISETVTSDGLDISVLLIPDE